MAIKDKFTWADFLKQNPEAKEKKLKRTSTEGQKAFEKAYKDFAKTYLKTREERVASETERTNKRKTELVTRLKGLEGRRKHVRQKKLNKAIGRYDAFLAKLGKSKASLKEASKKV